MLLWLICMILGHLNVLEYENNIPGDFENYPVGISWNFLAPRSKKINSVILVLTGLLKSIIEHRAPPKHNEGNNLNLMLSPS